MSDFVPTLRVPLEIKGSLKTEEQIRRYLVGRRADLSEALTVCESEPEVVLAIALVSAEDANGPFLRLEEGASRGGRHKWATGRGGVLHLQYPTKINGDAIRIDFVLSKDGKRFAIETDGHDWHERTPEQAARDKSRDRALTADGWTPLRFTGSEVFTNPDKCAADILKMVGVMPVVPPPLSMSKRPSPLPPAQEPTISTFEPVDVKVGSAGILAALLAEGDDELMSTSRPFAPPRRPR